MAKKIIITGATGLVGKNISSELIKKSEEVIVFTRNVEAGKNKVPNASMYLKWNYDKPEEWKEHINNSKAIIHLAGANLASKRWSKKYKKIITESRIKSTQNLIKAVSEAKNKPEVFICSSAVGYYGNSGDTLLTEDSAPGNDFLANLCIQWEKAAEEIETFGIRRVSIRSGLVLSKEEGILKKFLLPYNLYVGGKLGNGNQWFPWIHINDLVNIYLFSLYNKIDGAINAVSTNPLRMKEFAFELGKTLNKPSFFKVPEFLLKVVLGEQAKAALSSLRVIPQKLNNQDFKFQFENISLCLKNLLK
ncbi:MAG: TIGR01777 family protein [Ignavibacteria bacterium GWA2_35_9]|nr:MAG: TIGR01777 family protein [Ignavibacteria bacterium GWA2_35_9]OGU43784.1 MAG: TIGR01777 family protein [Ignavibacteria bacterium GWB2_36_8]OGU50308.1 MAG: TIGR01777 family protein [Ignavibacteria bacterium GWC2_36_12]